MKHKIEYSKIAVRDLDRIWTEVFEVSENYDTTLKYINDLMDKIEAKADYPGSGSPLYYENSFTGYYFVVFKAYIAFYHIENDKMFIDRILFGKSDYMRHLNLGIDYED